MTRTLIPASADVILRHGSHVLLLRRADCANEYPLHWAFPGGKVEGNELFTECALRELREEVGIFANRESISREIILMRRNIRGTKIEYFCEIEDFEGIPEVLEPKLATDVLWFHIDELPELMVPHHKIALTDMLDGKSYREFDTLP